MYAIISELDAESSVIVGNLWQKLREACGLKAIYNIPRPHLTWFSTDDIDVSEAMARLSSISESTRSLTIHTFGFGIFSGKNPVLYLPMVKSEEMIKLHNEIWDQIHLISEGPKLYYSPRLWVPHITLALKDLTQENLACAVNAIAFDPIELFVTINNLALVEHLDNQLGKTLENYNFRVTDHET